MATGSKKKEEQKGPKPYEVIIGALLSIILGVLLAMVYLVVQPVEEVDELPAEALRDRRTVYFVEGQTGSAADFNWRPKVTSFEAGAAGTIELVEQELNQWVGSAFPNLEDTEAEGLLTLVPRSVNFRIQDGALQIASDMEVNVFGVGREVLAQIRGSIVQRDGRYVFEADSMAIGGFRMQHDAVMDLILKRLFAAFDPSEEVTESWSRLARAEVRDDALILELP